MVKEVKEEDCSTMSATTPESFNSAAARAARRVQCVAGHVQAGEQGLVAVQGVSATEMLDGMTTLRAERAGGSFDVRAMTHLLDGGEEITRIKEEYVALLEREPLMLDAGFYDRTREQARYRVMQKMKRFGELKPEDPLRSKIFNDLVSLHDASFSTRMGVHYTLFIGALTGQATKGTCKCTNDYHYHSNTITPYYLLFIMHYCVIFII